MTQQDLEQLATVSDLQELPTVSDLEEFEKRLVKRFHIMLGEAVRKLAINQLSQAPKNENTTYDERPFYRPREVANMLGVSISTIHAWCNDGTIKALQEGGKGTIWLIPVAEIIRMKDEINTIEPKQPE